MESAMKLTQKRIGTLPAGRHGDADCKTLFVVVQPSGSRAFVQRLTVNGKRVDRGLGGWPLRTLAEARAIASANRRAARLDGRDPFTVPHNLKPLFRDAAEATLAANRGRWSESSARAFMQPLRGCDVLRVLGGRRVNAISRQDIIAVLKPVWTSKPAESRKALQRLRAVFEWCLAHGHVSENVAANGGIKAALPIQERVRRHHEAVPYRDVPSAYRSILGSRAADSARACAAFLVLTATRSAEARGARWDEIDLGGRTWTIPAARMKGKRAHVVPLSDPALSILDERRGLHSGGFVFASERTGRALSQMGLTRTVQSIAGTIHGFRSSFRDWVSEETAHDFAVVETALAHAVGSGVERAYRRGDLLAKRRVLMDAWGEFVVVEK